jgi:DNA gyrase subunit B
MYFGDVGARGVEQFVYELVANPLDSYLANQATFVNVELNGTTISVVDDGPGMPFEQPSDLDGISLATKSLTHIHWTPSEDNHAPHVHLVTSGIGLAIVCIGSAQLTARSWRSGELWQQHFVRGIAQGSATVVEQGNSRGTSIEVIPDPEIFGQAKPRLELIRKALFETAHLFSGLKIGFDQERFYASQGLKMLGFVLLDLDPLDLRIDAKETMPFHVTLRHEDVWVEVAVFGEQRSPARARTFSWANGARTPEHGSHVQGLAKALKEVDWKPAMKLIHVVMYELKFAGPMKTKLDVPQIEELVHSIVREPLHEYRSAFQQT